MHPGIYTAEVTSLSPKATEKDVYDFFSYCGEVECLEFIRTGESSCTAYVTFKDAYALETAVLLSATEAREFVSTPGEAVTLAQEVVKTMVAKGYVLGKEALAKAKAFDESHQVSATAMAKMAELSNRIGLTDKVYGGIEKVKSVDKKYHVSEVTVSAASYTGRTAAAAANAAVNSSYFSKGALWVSTVLTRAANAAADLATHGAKKK